MIAAGSFTSCETPVIEPDDTEQTPGGNPGEDLDPNIPAGEEGEMTFEIDVPDQVTVDGPLDMTIVQTSSYTDPDGTVYECSPKATVSVAALKDTVFVTDIKQLTAIGETAAPEISEVGNSPVTHTICQAFEVGGQTVEFDLAYEVYTYVNSKKQNVEMPYVKLNPADFGSVAADTKGSSAVKLSDITVRPLSPATRSITVTDSTAYEVTVRFNLEAETANLAKTSKQSIPFDIVYVGVVTQTNTYPGAEYSYELKDSEGNALTGTEFIVEPGATFQLNLSQHSSYTDQNGAVTATPEAWTKITSPGKLRIANVEELVEKSKYVSIEVKSEKPEGKLPYYIFEEVKLDGDVIITELADNQDTYKATATYKQKAVPVNMENGDVLEFTYIVEYLGQIVNNGAEISYRLVDDIGEPLEGTCYTVHPNSTFELFIEQSGSYVDRGEVVTAFSLAWTRITSPDMVIVGKAEDLVNEIDRISFDIEYDEHDEMMPHYKLTDVTLDGEIAIEEVSSEYNDRIKIYKATATYKQKAIPVSVAGVEDIEFTFAVEYLGKVITSGEDYAYQITDGQGNPINENEYVFNIGPLGTLEINISQDYLHVYEDGSVEEIHPLAYTKVASPNVMLIENTDELIRKLSVITTECKSDELGGNRPYYKLGEFVLDGEVEISEDLSYKEDRAKFYKAIATYKQKATPVNIEGGQEYEFTYIIKYVGKIVETPINVEYKQEVIWEEAHHNIYTNSQIVVTRTATYSDGSIDETKFYSTKDFIMSVTSYDRKDNTGEIEYHNYGATDVNDSTIATCATGVPDLDHFAYEPANIELPAYKGPVGVWTEYEHMYTDELYNPDVQTAGFYGKQFGYRSLVISEYINDDMWYAPRNYKIDLIYFDRFCCVDGKLFTCEPLKHTHRWSVETIETPNRGTCRLHKLEADVTWLARDFYYAVVDTVYVKQPTGTPAARTQRSSTARSAASVQASDEAAMTFSVQTVPGSEPYTEHTRIRPDGTRTTVRRKGIVTDFRL